MRWSHGPSQAHCGLQRVLEPPQHLAWPEHMIRIENDIAKEERAVSRKPWRVMLWLAVVAGVLGTAGACGGPAPNVSQAPGQQGSAPETARLEPVSLAAGEKLKVVATTNIVGDIVHNVGGDQIQLTTLMGIGVDPHEYVPVPADSAAIHDAHVAFANGAGLEANLAVVLDNAGGQALRVQLTDGLQLRKLQGGSTTENQAGEDPHVWFDVHNVVLWVDTIEQTLSALDPANAESYKANAQAYQRQLEDLDAWIVGQVATIPEANRKLVTDHPAFGYFADRYGLQQVGAVYPISPSSEPSAQDIAALEDAIRQYQVPAVFSESTVNPKLAEQVAQDTGVEVITLYTGSLGGPGSGAESYIELMRFDVNAIVAALTPR
jgi:manganese/iron transport system substrate-binding protein